MLKRLTKKYGPDETERALRGAKLLGMRSLLQIGDAEGRGWRWAVETYWRNENNRRKHGKAPQVLRDILREMVK